MHPATLSAATLSALAVQNEDLQAEPQATGCVCSPSLCRCHVSDSLDDTLETRQLIPPRKTGSRNTDESPAQGHRGLYFSPAMCPKLSPCNISHHVNWYQLVSAGNKGAPHSCCCGEDSTETSEFPVGCCAAGLLS